MGCLLSILIIAMVEKAPRGTKIFMKTDSMSALTWIEKNRGNSKYEQVSFLAYSWLLIMTGYIIVGFTGVFSFIFKSQITDDLCALCPIYRSIEFGFSWSSRRVYIVTQGTCDHQGLS